MPTDSLPNSNQTRLIIFLAIWVSLIISWLAVRNNYVLSPDSLLYIFTAQTFLNYGLQAAAESYSWPFFSILVAWIHKLTGLSLVNSGYALIAVLYASLSCAFILLVKDLGGSTRTQLLALLIVSIFPTLNDYRDYITRDTGFWFFTLLSLQQLMRFALHNNFKHAINWFLLILAAIIFRTEAIFFAVLSPLAIFIDTHTTKKDRVKKVCILYGLPAGITMLGLLAIFSTSELSTKLRLIEELANLSTFFQSMKQEFDGTVDAFATLAPHEFAASDMGVVLTTGLIGLVIYTLLHALTAPYLILLCWPIKQQLFANIRQKKYLISYFFIIVLYLLLLSFKKYFMTDRFCVAAVLILMLALPFCIEKAWQKNTTKHSWHKFFIVFLLLVPALDSLISSGNSKEYIANATEWVKQNQSEDTQLLTNHQQIAVLGGSCLNSCFFDDTYNPLTQANINKHNLLAIRAKEDDTDQLNAIDSLTKSANWALIKTFNNEKGDRVFILSSPLPAKEPRQ